MKGSETNSWRRFVFAVAVACVLGLTADGRAIAGETGSTDEYAGVPATDSVLLDPFDPVPTIQFHHGCEGNCGRHCDHDCGEPRRCHEDCHWHGWYCPRDCYAMQQAGYRGYNLGWWRCANDCHDGDWWCDHDCQLEGWHCDQNCFVHEPCEHDCRNRPPYPRCGGDCSGEGERCLDVCYGWLIREYEEQLDQHNEQAQRYEDQSRWYFEHVIDRHHHFDHPDDGDRYVPPPDSGAYEPGEPDESGGPGMYGPPPAPGPQDPDSGPYGPPPPDPGDYGPPQ